MKDPVNTVEEEKEAGFLQRFHHRKLNARRGAQVSPDSVPMDPEGQPAAEDPPGRPLLTDHDMPPVETLTAESDFSGFLSDGVSETLRRAALRRLWRVADFEFIDDLDIYAGDYTEYEPLGGMVTAEMKHRMEMEAKRQMKPMAELEELDTVEDESLGDSEIHLATEARGDDSVSLEVAPALKDKTKEREA